MSATIDPILAEFREEAATTKRVLDRVPEQKLAWKPHAKSMSLGQLAWHVAVIPGNISRLLQKDSLDVTQANFVPPQPKSLAEIINAYEQSVRDAEQNLGSMTDQQAKADWHLMHRDQVLSTMPRIGFLRSVMLNHWYHHRGQLSVYLRLLEVPLPVIYGPSADESPFA
jgi:uncharacterized damage-inducible protein DinB